MNKKIYAIFLVCARCVNGSLNKNERKEEVFKEIKRRENKISLSLFKNDFLWFLAVNT